jgi:CRISPR-associated protein (TIGR02584 family)
MTVKVILLAITGLTPQVLTETLYAMHQQGQVLPSQIHILTTADGYERARLTLINEGWLQKFYEDFKLLMPDFTQHHIHVLQQANGEPLVDIRTQSDNQAMADSITEWIRLLTTDPLTVLHVSIAGGRKTMGFYAGYALSLYGRKQDCLSHVLVSTEYESHSEFYYPTPYSHVIYGNDNARKPLDTQNAHVMIADIPFVRLRHGLDEALLQGQSSFSQSVAKAQQGLDPARLSIDLKQCVIRAQGTVIKLRPADLAFYSWLIKRQLANQPFPTCPYDGSPEKIYADQYLDVYRSIKGELSEMDRTLNTLQYGMSKAFFEQRKSRINKLLRDILAQASVPYLIAAVGKRPHTHYQISLKTEQIDYL